MSVLVTAVVDGVTAAEAAVDLLVRNGFPTEDIDVLDSSPALDGGTGEKSAAPLAIGGVLGALGGWFAVAGALATGEASLTLVAAALAGLALGGAAGGLLGAAFSAPAAPARAAAPASPLRVLVHAAPARLGAARAALAAAGARDLGVA